MKFEVTDDFEKSLKRLAKKYKSLKGEYLELLKELENNPFIGVEIIANCRKVRLSIKSKGKGKSGGARVIFYYEIINDRIVLIYIYDKSEMENVKDDFVRTLLQPFTNSKKK
ncbi:MAG: type II toxin-antitoxin system RelE/ParE family toxin [Paludibacter sp.]